MQNLENDVPGEQPSAEDAANPTALQAIQAVLTELEHRDADAAVRLFIKEQTLALLPKDAELLEWLIKTIGKGDTEKLITAFAHAPCLNCKKGLQRCESCDGIGNFKNEMICELCFGFGLTACNFCGGTGWATIDFVPAGLRFVVFVDRLKIAATRAKALFSIPLPTPEKEIASETLAKYAQMLLDLNRQIAILEGVISVPMQIVKTTHVPMPPSTEIIRRSISVALKSKKRLAEIVRAMAVAAQMDAQNHDKESKAHQLSVKRADFYSSHIASVPPFSGSFLEHPLLNKVDTKLVSDKSPHTKKGN
jgi:hypothetical protein